MGLNLIDYASINVDKVKVKFGRTLKLNSLSNEKIIVQTSSATPSIVVNPFKKINTLSDYNTIARMLTLYWNKTLVSEQEYLIRFVGLLDASNEVIPEEYIIFTKKDAATPSGVSSISVPTLEEVHVEDKSILVEAYSSYQLIAKNPEFYIKNVEPNNGSLQIDKNYNDGRLTISFNARPATNFLTNKYFKVQRKKIQRTPSRWETLTTRVQMHSWKPEVYIDFPSNDATPVFYTENKTYFETGYKYRVTVSKEIGI